MEGTRALRWARVDWGPFWERECCGFLGREKSWSETTILRAETKLDSRPGGKGDQQSPAPSGWGPDVVLRGRGPEGFHGQAALAPPA